MLENAMEIFNGMMQEIKQMKSEEHSERIPQLDEEIWDYMFKKACKKGWQEEDESTIENSQVNNELKNLFDFEDLCGINNTPV